MNTGRRRRRRRRRRKGKASQNRQHKATIVPDLQ